MFVDPFTRVRQERPEQHGQHTTNFDEIIKNLIQPRGLRRIFGQLERRSLIHVLVRASDKSPNGFERGLELKIAQFLLYG